MEWKKVKWLMIALLLAVNIFLGINIAYKYTRAIISEKNSLRQAVSTAPSSLGFSADIFEKLPRYLYSYTGSRDIDAENRLASSILHGDLESADAGGGVFIYKSTDVERLEFRRSGSVTGIVVSDADINITDIIKRSARSSGFEVSSSDEGLSFSFDSVPVANAFYSQVLHGSHLSLSGLVPLSDEWTREQKGLSRGEMVLALKIIIEENSLGSLDSVRTVYYAEAGDSRTLLLTPAWQVQCTGGSFTVSLVNKSLLETTFK